MALADIQEKLSAVLVRAGFECHPLKIGRYNDQVGDKFQLDYEYESLAFIIISQPTMFEKGFLPFMNEQKYTGIRDPIDECMIYYFQQAKQAVSDYESETLHDFELHHTRRPKILVQTAGHVAGAARYYQRGDVQNPPWTDQKKIFGVSIHPRFGGWFALRGVIIFPHVKVPDLVAKEPPDVIADEAGRIELLERFNGNWRDWTYRDVVPVEARYSEQQKLYFATKPADRTELIKSMRSSLPDKPS